MMIKVPEERTEEKMSKSLDGKAAIITGGQYQLALIQYGDNAAARFTGRLYFLYFIIAAYCNILKDTMRWDIVFSSFKSMSVISFILLIL